MKALCYYFVLLLVSALTQCKPLSKDSELTITFTKGTYTVSAGNSAQIEISLSSVLSKPLQLKIGTDPADHIVLNPADATAGTDFFLATELSLPVDSVTVSLVVDTAPPGGKTLTFTLQNLPEELKRGDISSVTLRIEASSSDPIPSGLIPIHHLEQLDFMRHDFDGNGVVNAQATPEATAALQEKYDNLFPGVKEGREAGNTYQGFMLIRSLNFNEDDSYLNPDQNKARWTTGHGWPPIGFSGGNQYVFNTHFDGNGKTITGLYIDWPASDPENEYPTKGIPYIGLFGVCGNIPPTGNFSIRNLGLIEPRVTGRNRIGVNGGNGTAALVGDISMNVISCYVIGGSIQGYGAASLVAGGLYSRKTIKNCYAKDVNVNGNTIAGGLIGTVSKCTVVNCFVKGGTIRRATSGRFNTLGGLMGDGYETIIRACYVYGSTLQGTGGGGIAALVGGVGSQDLSIIASYAGGMNYSRVLGPKGPYGRNRTITTSYHQIADSEAEDEDSKHANTLTTTTTFTGIYADWNINAEGNTASDATKQVWDLGDATQYPVLKIDTNLDGNIDQEDMAVQR